MTQTVTELESQLEAAKKCVEILRDTLKLYDAQYETYTSRESGEIAVNKWEKHLVDTIPDALAAYEKQRSRNHE